jgi:alanyl-tRNA synthetase
MAGSVNDIRKTFLDYFKKNGHEIVPSAPLVPANDPTLMFTSAGMVQFKNLFLGQEVRSYKRAVSSQKCLRAGGKHNDLDNVGFTARHHTFFEMLGNFSFGDYFKEDAIALAWGLISKEFALPKDKLLVTVYHDDEEAVKIWKKVAGFGDDKIIRIATSDNFWSAGDTGPCGPCSEIFIDGGDKIYGGPPGSPDQDGDRYLEFWNNVFMQYDQVDGKKVPLPKPSIDTGMGLERISAILQGKHDAYDCDIIRGIIEASASVTNTDPDGPFKVSHRVIADHLRAACFLIADGILPSNEGRGYVERRIMRRAMRHAQLLGTTEPLMHRLVPALVARMGETYPELKAAQDLITETLKNEEVRFRKTLENGLHLLKAETDKLGTGQKLPGDVAFKLYDTFGFPLDLTQDVLKREQKREVDVTGFEAAMEAQKEVARKSWKGSGEAATEKVWFDIREQNGSTEFLGYDLEEAEGQVVAIVRGGIKTPSAKKGDGDSNIAIVVNQTPFYGESGGQVGDTGAISSSNAKLKVNDTQKRAGGVFVHFCDIIEGEIKTGDAVVMQVDKTRRGAIRGHHSVTHILHSALRRHLGKHVAQKGSLVSDERLRFDISQPVAMTEEQITAVEREVNDRIRMNSPVETRLMAIDDARAMGAMALFGEKYDDEVRVVSMGGNDPDEAAKIYSIELCGGTHVKRTGDIGLLKIVSESALASGVRRVEAVAGHAALAYLAEQEKRLQDIAALLKTSPAEAVARVEALANDKKRMEKEISDLRRKVAAGGGGDAAPEVKTIKGIKFTSRVLEGIPAGDLKPLADDLKAKMGSGVVALISVSEDGKASLVVGVTKDLTPGIDAVNLVKIGAEKLGGKGGGGRSDMAQAGGTDGKLANDAVTAIETALAG